MKITSIYKIQWLSLGRKIFASHQKKKSVKYKGREQNQSGRLSLQLYIISVIIDFYLYIISSFVTG